MFVCIPCLEEKYEGPARDFALEMTKAGFGSRGPCEVCREINSCADIPSSSPGWWIKKEKSNDRT